MRVVIFLSFLSLGFFAVANEPSSAIYLKLQKLHSLKRVLYVAAHPDDENTRALAWFSLGQQAETAYFSLTRGDGGQNLIGNELGDGLGVLRTQELLAARSYDKAKQYFSHAVDFGYSRSAEESFAKWGKDVLLCDLVEMIRRFQPDVIITRFPPDERAGHGHHTASALLALEAFDKAADPNYLPAQVKRLGTWKATSVYWNTSAWWDKSIDESTKEDPDYLIFDIGEYNSFLGKSYNEIGTLARSQHKCQGFGDIVERGSRIEYFKYMAGTRLKNSFFEENKRRWDVLANAQIEGIFGELMDNFNFIDPSSNVPLLMALLAQLENMAPSILRDEKVALCKEIITDCLGLFSELVGDDFFCVVGDSVSLKLNLTNRSGLQVKLDEIRFKDSKILKYNEILPMNTGWSKEIKTLVGGKISTPFWLKNPHDALFEISENEDALLAENPPSMQAEIVLNIGGKQLLLPLAADYKWRDPSYGERRRPLIMVPAFTATFEEQSTIIKSGQQKEIRVKLRSFKKNLGDQLRLNVPTGWTLDRATQSVDIESVHGEMTLSYILTAGPKAESGILTLTNEAGERLFGYQEIKYDHIPTQTIFNQAQMNCVILDAAIVPGKIAYIKGVEDGLPAAMRQLGFEVDEFEVGALSTLDLSSYRSVVLGIRIYNVHEELKNFDKQLFDYVQKGGNVVMQYNTAPRSSDGMTFGPKPFTISRDRVTEEDAKVTFLQPKHPIMNVPNKISQSDFEGWVQERGLYFASDWDASYIPLFSWADTGEQPVEGALIAMPYGKGQFVYTGISFFRELPAGVVGAYRLLANILSYTP